jgi:hypothetical protein
MEQSLVCSVLLVRRAHGRRGDGYEQYYLLGWTSCRRCGGPFFLRFALNGQTRDFSFSRRLWQHHRESDWPAPQTSSCRRCEATASLFRASAVSLSSVSRRFLHGPLQPAPNCDQSPRLSAVANADPLDVKLHCREPRSHPPSVYCNVGPLWVQSGHVRCTSLCPLRANSGHCSELSAELSARSGRCLLPTSWEPILLEFISIHRVPLER